MDGGLPRRRGPRWIGVDVDQSSESDTVITSAMKLLSNSVYDGVKDFYDGSFPGGKTSVFTVANSGVGLPMEPPSLRSSIRNSMTPSTRSWRTARSR